MVELTMNYEQVTNVSIPPGARIVEACIECSGNTYRFAPMCDGSWVCFEYDLGADPGRPKARIDAGSCRELMAKIELRATTHYAVAGPRDVDADGATVGGTA